MASICKNHNGNVVEEVDLGRWRAVGWAEGDRRCTLHATWTIGTANRKHIKRKLISGSTRPHLHRDWAHPGHICTGIGLTPATSAPGLGSPRPHLPHSGV